MAKVDRYGRRLRRKRCQRCGRVAWLRERMRHCRQRAFGRGSYACWGTLVDAPILRRKADAIAASSGVGIGWALSEEAAEMQVRANGARMRADAQRKYDEANEKIVDKQRQVARLARAISELQRRARHYQKRAAMTDAEIAAEKAAREQRAEARRVRTRRRSLALGEEAVP
jgi:hypothetical protein